METNSEVLKGILKNTLGIGVFSKFNEYQKLMEGFLEKEINEFDSSFDKISILEESKKAGEEQNSYYAFLIESHQAEKYRLSIEFFNSFRISFLIQVFSFLECELKQICDFHHKLYKTDISLSDLKGTSDFDKIKIYLTKVWKINIEELNTEWIYFRNIQKLRNLFIHHNGEISKNNSDFTKIENISGSIKNIRLKPKYMDSDDVFIFIIDKSFGGDFLKTVELFFEKLLKRMNNKF